MFDRIHPNLHVRRLIGMGVVTLAMALCTWWMFNLLTPPQDNPFKPLKLTAKPGLATGLKLDRLAHDPAQCFALLDAAGVKYTRIEQRGPLPQCGLHDALKLDRSLTPYSANVSMTCRLAASLKVIAQQFALAGHGEQQQLGRRDRGGVRALLVQLAPERAQFLLAQVSMVFDRRACDGAAQRLENLALDPFGTDQRHREGGQAGSTQHEIGGAGRTAESDAADTGSQRGTR